MMDDTTTTTAATDTVDFETQYTIGQKYALRLSDILLEHSSILKCEHCKKILNQALEIMKTATENESKKD